MRLAVRQYGRLAGWLHVSEGSTLRLQDALGGDCVGSVSLHRWKTMGPMLPTSQTPIMRNRKG